MLRTILSLLLIASLSQAGNISECFDSKGRFDSNIGHDTLDCGNVDVRSWAIGVVEAMIEISHDDQEDIDVLDACSVLKEDDESSLLLINACKLLMGSK